MTPMMAAGIAQGALSIFGGMAQNAAIRDAATKQYESNKLFIERDQAVLNENLLFAGDEANRATGMALTNLNYEALKAFGTQEAKRAETNIYGNTALRQQAAAQTRKAMIADNIVQQGEAAVMNINNKLRENKYQTEAKHAQNAQSYNNAMSQQKSTFDLMVGGATAGLGGYMQATNFMASQNALAIQGAQAAQLGATLPYAP